MFIKSTYYFLDFDLQKQTDKRNSKKNKYFEWNVWKHYLFINRRREDITVD